VDSTLRQVLPREGIVVPTKPESMDGINQAPLKITLNTGEFAFGSRNHTFTTGTSQDDAARETHACHCILRRAAKETLICRY
jgi:hypothetical protein